MYQYKSLMNEDMKRELDELFHKLSEEIESYVEKSFVDKDTMIKHITGRVSNEVTNATAGYIYDVYSNFTKQVKQDPFFQDPIHLNAFYRLDLQEKLNQKYQFNIKDINTYKNGIQYHEINRLYASIAAAAGTVAVGGILEFALTNVLTIPFVIIIAGAVAAAAAAWVGVSKSNQKNLKTSIDNYLQNMKGEIRSWVLEIDNYFMDQISKLYTTC